jgi:hypothetical protein
MEWLEKVYEIQFDLKEHLKFRDESLFSFSLVLYCILGNISMEWS